MTGDTLAVGVESDAPATASSRYFRSRHFEWQGGPYRALDHVFVVRTETAEGFEPRLSAALEPLLGGEPLTPAVCYSLVDRGPSRRAGRYAVYADSRRVKTSASRFVAAATIQWLVNQAAVVRLARHEVLLHAGAVERDGLVVLLPAPMDSGKSTTVAALLAAGWRYLSDEIAALDSQTLGVRAYPKALTLDRSAIAVLGDVRPPFPGAAHEPQWTVRAADLGSTEPAEEGKPPVLVVFPRYVPGSHAAPRRLSDADTLLGLAGSTFRFDADPSHALPILGQLARSVPAYALDTDDLARAVVAVDSLVTATPPQPGQDRSHRRVH